MQRKPVFTAMAVFLSAVQGLNILITNDDGFGSANIRAMYKAVKDLGHDAYIVASSSDMSGQGGRSAYTTEANLTADSEWGIVKAGAPSIGQDPKDSHIWYYNGTPAAQVFVALDHVLPLFGSFSKPDLVLAGPNVGLNLGPFLYTLSGTMGATYAAVDRGIPAISFSAAYSRQTPYYWTNTSTLAGLQDPATIAGRLAAALAQAFIDKAAGGRILPVGYGINVNLPYITSFSNDSCVNPPFVLTRMSGGADVDKAVYNATTGLFHYGDLDEAGSGVNACINGDCSLPGETDVVSGHGACQASVSVFTVDYDAPYTASRSNATIGNPYALVPGIVQLQNASRLVGGLGANATVRGVSGSPSTTVGSSPRASTSAVISSASDIRLSVAMLLGFLVAALMHMTSKMAEAQGSQSDNSSPALANCTDKQQKGTSIPIAADAGWSPSRPHPVSVSFHGAYSRVPGARVASAVQTTDDEEGRTNGGTAKRRSGRYGPVQIWSWSPDRLSVVCGRPPATAMLPDPSLTVTLPSLHDGTVLDCRVYLPPATLLKAQTVETTKSVDARWRGHAAVVAHPYAPMGGSYNDGIVRMVADTLLQRPAQPFVVATFNFRGAGRRPSGHTSWTARAETGDYMTVAGFLYYFVHHLDPYGDGGLSGGSTHRPPVFLFAGYSYGAIVTRLLPPMADVLALLARPDIDSPAAEVRRRAARWAAMQNADFAEHRSALVAAAERGADSPQKKLVRRARLSMGIRVGGSEDNNNNNNNSNNNNSSSSNSPRRCSQEVARTVNTALMGTSKLRTPAVPVARGSNSSSRPSAEGPVTAVADIREEGDRDEDDEIDTSRLSALPNLPVFRPSYLLVSFPAGLVTSLATVFTFPPSEGPTLPPSEAKLADHPTLAVYGDADRFVSMRHMHHWTARMTTASTTTAGKTPGFRALEVAAAGHFWSEGRSLYDLRDAVSRFADELVAGPPAGTDGDDDDREKRKGGNSTSVA
ncbi:acid phosphatase [Grosmannia clavigera kw1407]|uniref:Acid phosphatase n=1 Tax=Grosmannia clavigera (strain kw1407 / UAMH 11150) TaxID=655863 RepID=F0XIR7_GROCL|nr:acid phosphatase [Grosmannia clavigera kw1407]EFX02272.1 acid phosphatase [Grosmannia clavigera kw1407]